MNANDVKVVQEAFERVDAAKKAVDVARIATAAQNAVVVTAKKAVEEAIAAKKAVEEAIAADQKAAEEAIAADQKAAEEAIAAKQIAEEADKKAADDAVKAAEEANAAKKVAEEAIAAKKAAEEADKKAAEEAVKLVSMYMKIPVVKPLDSTLYTMLIEHTKLIEAKHTIKKQSEGLNVLYNANDVLVITQLYKDISEITAKIKQAQTLSNI